MQDLRNMMGIFTVESQVEKRQLVYLGHLGRYPPTRLERQMLGGWLASDGMSAPKVANTTKITFRSRYSELIQKIFKQSDEPINNWEEDWTHLASKGAPAGSWWKRVSTQKTKETEARAQQQVWQAVHEEDLEPPPHLQATPCEAPNFFVCPKCKTEQHKYFFRRHLKTCDGTPPPKTAMCHKPVVTCKDCSKQVRNPRQHRSFCKKKNKITRRLWGKQAPGQRPVQQRQPNR